MLLLHNQNNASCEEQGRDMECHRRRTFSAVVVRESSGAASSESAESTAEKVLCRRNWLGSPEVLLLASRCSQLNIGLPRIACISCERAGRTALRARTVLSGEGAARECLGEWRLLEGRRTEQTTESRPRLADLLIALLPSPFHSHFVANCILLYADPCSPCRSILRPSWDRISETILQVPEHANCILAGCCSYCTHCVMGSPYRLPQNNPRPVARPRSVTIIRRPKVASKADEDAHSSRACVV